MGGALTPMHKCAVRCLRGQWRISVGSLNVGQGSLQRAETVFNGRGKRNVIESEGKQRQD